MIRFAVSRLAEYSEHPLLAGLFVIAAMFLLAGGIAEFGLGNAPAAGFMGVYAVMFAFMGALGYALLGFSRATTKLQRQFDIS